MARIASINCSLVLIESDWNLKSKEFEIVDTGETVLIESDWNLKF